MIFYFSFSVLLHSNLCPSPWVYRVGVTVSLWKPNHQNMAARKLSAMPISRLSLKRVSASTLWDLKDLFLEPWASVLEVWLLWGRHSVRKFKLLPKGGQMRTECNSWSFPSPQLRSQDGGMEGAIPAVWSKFLTHRMRNIWRITKPRSFRVVCFTVIDG